MAKRKSKPAAKQATPAKSKRAAAPEPTRPSVGRPARPPVDGFSGRLGQRLKALRQSRGMTARELVDATQGEVSKSAIYRFEAGEISPTIAALSALCKAMGTTMSDLLKGLAE